MFRRSLNVLALLGMLLALVVAVRPAAAAQNDLLPDQYLVIFKPEVTDPGPRAQQLAARFGLTLDYTYTAVPGFAARIPAGILDSLRALPEVAFIQQDQLMRATAQDLPTGINRIDADTSPSARIDGNDERVDVDVAVIDTGIDTSHNDLNVVGGFSCMSRPRFYNDENGHGTHVAGTIGALDNHSGVVGVAPGARLWAVQVLNSQGSGTISSVVCGIDWVLLHAGQIEVANMSLGGSGSDDGRCGLTNGDAIHLAICQAVNAGVTFVVAAGNYSSDASTFIPAAYDEVITVAALADFDGQPGGHGRPNCSDGLYDEDDTLAFFSNYGSDIDLIAPGECILSTWKENSYNTISGTSMASPHVAGAAALYKANHPATSPQQVKQALQSSGTNNWDNRDDPDGIKESLVNVDGF